MSRHKYALLFSAVFLICVISILLMRSHWEDHKSGKARLITSDGVRPTAPQTERQSAPEGRDNPSTVPHPRQIEAFLARAKVTSARIAKELNELYFSFEKADLWVFGASERYEERKRRLKELLLSGEDASILASVVLVVEENSDKAVSIKRLRSEIITAIRSDEKIHGWARSRELTSFLADQLCDPNVALTARAFAGQILGEHVQDIAFRHPENVPPSAYCLDEKALAAISGLLSTSVAARGESDLVHLLLEITGPYMFSSPAVREAYVRLVANPPEDPALNKRLVRVLAMQNWPVYDQPIVFEFLMAQLRPDNDPSLLGTIASAFGSTPLLNGDDPRVQIYSERLAAVYWNTESKGSKGPRQDIVQTVVQLDVEGGHAIVQDYLLNADVPSDTKRFLLSCIEQIAKGTRKPDHRYAKTRASLALALDKAKEAFGNAEELQSMADECIQALRK